MSDPLHTPRFRRPWLVLIGLIKTYAVVHMESLHIMFHLPGALTLGLDCTVNPPPMPAIYLDVPNLFDLSQRELATWGVRKTQLSGICVG